MPQPDRSAECTEKIGIRVIRLRQPHLRTTGIVGSMAGADKVLLEWSIQLHGCVVCEFEIVYVDGRVLSGHYEFRRKGAARPSLALHLRHWIKLMLEQGNGAAGPCGRPGDCGAALSFLEQYDADEFWPVH